jgi:hypothetical protein
VSIVFSSKVSKESRHATESLFFFNPRQYRVRDAVINSLKEYGEPRIEEKGNDLCLGVGSGYAQTLFAFDSERLDQHPVGVIVFLRSSRTEIVILHLAVHPDYVLGRRGSDPGLAFELVDKVKEIASRIKGVTRLVLSYDPKATFLVRAHISSAASVPELNKDRDDNPQCSILSK